MSMNTMTRLLEKHIKRTSEALSTMIVGSEEYSRTIKDLGELYRRRNEAYSTEQNVLDMEIRRQRQQEMDDVNRLDMYERREEQKRFNNESLKQKEQHVTMDFWRFLSDVGLRTLQMTMYGYFTNRAFEFNKNGDMIPSSRETKYTDLLMRK